MSVPAPRPPQAPAPDPVVGIPVVPTDAPGCFGPSAPMTVWSATPYAEVHFGAASGLFLIDFGTTGSTIDPSTITPRPDGSLGCYPGADFFGRWPCLPLRTTDHSGIATPFRQSGILGTDVLAQHAYVLDYRAGRLHRADAGTFCTDAALTAAHLIPLETSGYGPGRDRARAHVPAVAVSIGGASAPAQLDSGFADRRYRHSINVNRAFFSAMSGTLVPRPERDLTLTTCVAGVSEPVRAYTIEGGVGFVGLDGAIARSFGDATIFLKDTPPAAARCGGIGTWTEPGAQLGASFLETVGRLVVDPGAGRIWIAAE